MKEPKTAIAVQPDQDTVEDRMQRPGDILLFYRPKGGSRMLAWLMKSPYYHVAICDDTYHVIECRPKEVIRRDLRSKLGGHTFAVIPAPSGSGAAALEWARQEIGAKYDVWELLGMVLDRIFTHLHINYRAPGNRYTCGSFVAEAFKRAGADLFPGQDPKDVLPSDFARLLPPAELAAAEELRRI